MNIKEAKQEIIRTVNAYRRKDEAGMYEIPVVQQRPILLMGPPGIGKTAVMEQVARECGIGLVSYTITHHTRQSAIGLPVIAHHQYDGKEYTVTEYTMSEIVASVYDRIEQTGIKEGILFLDEINCVSETLFPTMLQFLQYKTFGTHPVPAGWIIVTAGNPVQYNRSAREFDIVTLDRVKRIDIEADPDVFKEYARAADIHGAILSYLDIYPQNFYRTRTELSGRYFVTARGWEDLSRMILSYEKMEEPVTEQMTVQYLQDPEIARDFTLYYDLYRKYSEVYHIDAILETAYAAEPEQLRQIPFDEKLSLIRLLSDNLHSEFRVSQETGIVQETLHRHLLQFRDRIRNQEQKERPADNSSSHESVYSLELLASTGRKMRSEYKEKASFGLLGREEERESFLASKAWDELVSFIRDKSALEGSRREGFPEEAEYIFSLVREWFASREEQREAADDHTNRHLTNAFSFLASIYGTGQEIVMFLTSLNTDPCFLRFVEYMENEAYEKYNQLLLLHDRHEKLRREILS